MQATKVNEVVRWQVIESVLITELGIVFADTFTVRV